MNRLLFITLLATVNLALGQGYVPPSPDAMGLARMASIPVSQYTGTAAINIPLTEVGGKEFAIPVGLSYNATGIRVADMASSVGLGWNLNAGGVITRVVRGLPDDLTSGYCTSGATDLEPDLYFYNFQGQSGKFVLNKSGVAIVMPFRPIVIRPGICASGSNGTWEVIDENGVSYKFGASSSAREVTTATEISGTERTYTSSWLLSSVTNPNATEQILFSYSSGQTSTKNFFFYEVKDVCGVTLKDLTSTVATQTKYISSITSPLGSVYFSYISGRKDVPGALYLKELTASNNSGFYQKWRFEYSYFQDTQCSLPECYRLKLEKIFDLAPDPAYEFAYYWITNLPSRYSKDFDSWGYYNGASNTSWVAQITYPSSIQGASRSSSIGGSKANTLISIAQRGGATKTFDYELHEIAGYSGYLGGLRIKSISESDGNGSTYNKSYKYLTEGGQASGTIHGFPSYSIIVEADLNNVIWRYFRFSHSYRDIYDLNGANIGYSRVEEEVANNGKSVFYFTNYETHPDSYYNGYHKTDYSWKRGNPTEVRQYSNTGALLHKQTLQYNFDLPNKSSINFKHYQGYAWNNCVGGAYVIQQDKENISRAVTLTKKTVETFSPSDVNKKQSIITDFSYDANTNLPIEAIQYDQINPGQKLIQRVKFATHGDYYNLVGQDCYDQYQSCMTTCASEPDPQVRADCESGCYNTYANCNFTVSTSDPATAAVFELGNKHRIATPIETTSLFTDGSLTNVLSSNVNIFNVSGSRVQLKETWGMAQPVVESNYTKTKILANGTFEKDSRLRKIGSFNSYDGTSGNLTQQTSFGGIQTTYTWDATNTLILSTTSSGGVNSRTSSATYKPLVGKTSTTDPNGLVTSYEYDVYNRVNTVKDENGKALQHYRYHYKNETPGFRINTSRTEGIVNETLYFSAIEIAASTGGTPTFLWDFGDGTVVDNNSTSVNHAYSSPGTYTLKLVGMNPVYGPVTRTLQVGVYSSMSVSNCEDGPTNIDYCGVETPGFGSCTVNNTYSYSPVEITATPSNGCPSSYTYYWEYRNISTGSWSTLTGNGATIVFYPPPLVGTYEIRCTVTDGCGNIVQSSSYVTMYKSDPNCQGGYQY